MPFAIILGENELKEGLVTVKEQRYTAAIEGCINGIQLRVLFIIFWAEQMLIYFTKNFVAQCLEDYKLFFRVFTDTTEALGRKASVHCWFRPRKPEALLAPPMSDREVNDTSLYVFLATHCRFCSAP